MEAESRRNALAAEHPEATWLISEVKPGNWEVVRVGLEPGSPATGEMIEERSRPPYEDDPRSAYERNARYGIF